MTAWVVFPAVLALLCGGWGLLARRLLAPDLDGALVLPLGLAVVVVLSGLLTASSAIAPADVPVLAVGAVVGLALAWRGRGGRPGAPDGALVATALLTVLAFGAPVLLSGSATFTGYLKLDDTSTWLGIVDRVTTHGRSLAGLAPSTYALNLHEYLHTMGYPIGAFLPLGIARALTGADAAWCFAPYLACCAGALALAIHSLARPIVTARWLRAGLAVLAAGSSLLYGYGQWGAIKELCGACLLALLAALVTRALRSGPERGPREAIVVAVGAAAVSDTLGPGAVAWLAPALGILAGGWLWRERVARSRAVAPLAVCAGATAILMLPVWLELSPFLHGSSELFSSLSATTATGQSGLVSLRHPITALQLAGPWPTGDFRFTAAAGPTAPFLVAVLLGLLAAAALAVRRHPALLLYPAIVLGACLIVRLGGANAWVTAKAVAMASPAFPAVAVAGAVALLARSRPAGAVLLALIGAGIVWSDVRQYHNVTLAPRARLAELQAFSPLLAGHGPTLLNEYETYADRHLLRDGTPTEPAEYRPFQLPLRDGTLLVQSAWSDPDSLAAGAVYGFGSILTRTSPVASRPPSVYALRRRGRYYELWQRPSAGGPRVLEHVPLGDSESLPYCGRSTTGYAPLCSVAPAAVPACTRIRGLAADAARSNARLVAYSRSSPVVLRADATRWPPGWIHDPAARTLTPTHPGAAQAAIAVPSAGRYAVWLGGSFARGFSVTVDGRPAGRVENELAYIGAFIRLDTIALGTGPHTVRVSYPSAGPGPGQGSQLTELSAIALEPQSPAPQLLTVAPGQAASLCGRSLDWVEVVR